MTDPAFPTPGGKKCSGRFTVSNRRAIRARAAWVVGPLASYVRNQLQDDPDKELIRHSDLPWPSDHKAVLVEYESPLR